MPRINAELAGRFAEIAELLRLEGSDPFRVRAYERAASAVAAASDDLGALDAERLSGLPGIGKATAAKIVEYRSTGQMALLTELRDRVPPAVRELTRVPGIGPKLAVRLHDELGVDSLDDLRDALDRGAVAAMAGAGERTAENLRAGLARVAAESGDRHPTADVLGFAEELRARLQAVDGVERVAVAGSLRRGAETVDGLDLLACAPDRAQAAVIAEATRGAAEVRTAADGAASFVAAAHRTAAGPLRVDVRVVDAPAWGAALVAVTGSESHYARLRERAAARGLSLGEDGLRRAGERVAGDTEEEVYAALGLPWIPAPLREDKSELEAADPDGAGGLPAVVTVADLRGDLHGHSDYSGDGRASLEDMVAAAAARGWAYWAVTDHAENLTINGVSRAALLERRRRLGRLSERYGIRVLDGLELNIGVDGGVDYDDAFLASFDFCVASVHSLLNRDEAVQTRRILRAMEHPMVHAIGHPTGRKIGQRPPYAIDVDAVLTKARATGTALEVNSHPRRLDLSGALVRAAVDAGVMLTISTDAHTVGELDNVVHGVATAQRGWATAQDVLNCRDLDGLLAFAEAKRG